MSTFQNPLSVKKNHNNDNITIDYLTKCFLSFLLKFFLFWSSKKCILSKGFGVLLHKANGFKKLRTISQEW